MRRVVPTPFPSDPLVADAAMFGAAVRAARTGAGMTLADAALTIGVAKQTLSDLETGRASVGLRLALRIARDLGVVLFAVPADQREAMRRLITAVADPAAEDVDDRVEKPRDNWGGQRHQAPR